jgi:hypothetical protein
MLKANGWRAIALAGLVVGLTSSPALGDTSVYEFMKTVSRGWNVQIKMTKNNDQIVSLTIVKNIREVVPVSVNNGLITNDEITKVYKFLEDKKVPRKQDSDKQDLDLAGELMLQARDFNSADPGQDHVGIQFRNEEDGSTSLRDRRGTAVGWIQKGASVFEEQKAVIRAAAHRNADALIPSGKRSLPASSPVFKQVAAMVKEDVDIAMPGNISAQRKQEIIYNGIRDGLFDLNFEVWDVMTEKSNVMKDSFPVNALKKICEDNGFEYDPPDPKNPNPALRRVFYIRDPRQDIVITVGQVTGDGKSVANSTLLHLRLANERTKLLKEIELHTPEEVSTAVEFTTQELKSIMEEVKNSMESDGKTGPPEKPGKEDPSRETSGGGKPLH